MGMKERSFAPLVNVSLEDLVRANHFYRHVERTLGKKEQRDEKFHENYLGFAKCYWLVANPL